MRTESPTVPSPLPSPPPNNLEHIKVSEGEIKEEEDLAVITTTHDDASSLIVPTVSQNPAEYPVIPLLGIDEMRWVTGNSKSKLDESPCFLERGH